MTTKTKKLLFLGAIFFLLLCYLIYNWRQKQLLLQHHKIVNGYVYHINHGSIIKGGSNVVISYYFFENGKKISARDESDLKYKVRHKLVNSYFPVVYDSTNPSNSKLLIWKDQWTRLGLQFPDSLDWLKHYYP